MRVRSLALAASLMALTVMTVGPPVDDLRAEASTDFKAEKLSKDTMPSDSLSDPVGWDNYTLAVEEGSLASAGVHSTTFKVEQIKVPVMLAASPFDKGKQGLPRGDPNTLTLRASSNANKALGDSLVIAFEAVTHFTEFGRC